MKKLVRVRVRALAVGAMAAALLLGQRSDARAGWSTYIVDQSAFLLRNPDPPTNSPYIEGGVWTEWVTPSYSQPANGAGAEGYVHAEANSGQTYPENWTGSAGISASVWYEYKFTWEDEQGVQRPSVCPVTQRTGGGAWSWAYVADAGFQNPIAVAQGTASQPSFTSSAALGGTELDSDYGALNPSESNSDITCSGVAGVWVAQWRVPQNSNDYFPVSATGQCGVNMALGQAAGEGSRWCEAYLRP